MKPLLKIAAYFLFTASILFVGCKKDKAVTCIGCSPPLPPPYSKAPYAQAGGDQIIVLPKDSVILDGSGSIDPDGKIVSYLWTQITGPGQVSITNKNLKVTTITGLLEGVYSFNLHVTDNNGAVNDDIVQIKALKNLIGYEYTLQQKWSSNDGAGADDDVYVTTGPFPDLYSNPNVPLAVYVQKDLSSVWADVPKDTSVLTANSQYYYLIRDDVLFIYASYPGSFRQLIGKGVTVKIRFL